MNSITPSDRSIFGLDRERFYKVFKYTVFLLLFFNIFYWLQEDFLASAHTYREGVSWQQIGNAFAQALDSFTWFLLLLIFELETAIISDKKLTSKVKWGLNLLAGICYLLIMFAFVGYATKFFMIFNFTPLPFNGGCDAVGTYLSYAIELDDYAALTTANCDGLSAPLFGNLGAGLIATKDVLYELKWLVTAETLNAAVWILIVFLLWIDLFIQLTNREHGPLYRINIVCKAILYFSLIVICLYLAFEAPFMEFWDALLWVIAFFFIELNIFQWASELKDTSPQQEETTKGTEQ